MCFRRVLTMVLDWFQFLGFQELWRRRSLPTEGGGCEQCGLKRKILGPGLGGSCTPPQKWLKSFANDTFSVCFDDGLGWCSILGEGGGTSCLWTGYEKTSFKCSYWAQGLEDHVPHPTNGSNLDTFWRWRWMVLSFWNLGKEGLIHEKALKIILHRGR